MALGYEDLNDHESLRHDAVFGTLLGKLEPKRRADCAALAGKSTLNRLELHESGGSSRYHKVRPDAPAIERLWVDLYLDAHRRAPRQIILDLDATDDPLHGHQEGRFFHGYYDGYCYCRCTFLRASICCARSCAARTSTGRLERAKRWTHCRSDPRTLEQSEDYPARGSGFCREELMSWCEQNAVDYVFGLAKNVRLVRSIGAQLRAAQVESRQTKGRHGASKN